MVNQLQQRLVKQIIIGYLSLILLTILLYVLDGLIEDELSSILATLTALSSLYIAPSFQLFGQSVNAIPGSEPTPLGTSVTDSPFVKLSNLLIPVHFLVVGLLIGIKSLNVISFKEMNLFLGFIETTFGTYMGHLLITLFNVDKHER